ncbi:hypothetical protein DFH07DRAFT_791891 [Mycena maculata]|uniref:DUF7587 domain-containing protein n=1 Tax=Mycena maculata TaxID=230809 RepID=A0AAD7NZX2_9AGAR|nr:hypothetical protein DFH07DRAFT_791891 [Mycena maculata]
MYFPTIQDLPAHAFDDYHEYRSITANPANQLLFRVHRASGRGALVPGTGFVASNCPTPVDDPARGFYNYGTGRQWYRDQGLLISAARRHVAQWQDSTWDLPSSFLSASFSLPYALFEAHRWNRYHGCTDTLISIIDTTKINSDAWLATQLIGSTQSRAAWFARSALEVIVYERIPESAIVATAPVGAFLDGLPRWCEKAEIRSGIHASKGEVATSLGYSARRNKTPEHECELVLHSVAQSIQMLRSRLPASMADYDPITHADAVDAIVRVATMFVWWTQWITWADPAAYPAYLQRVRAVVLQALAETSGT